MISKKVLLFVPGQGNEISYTWKSNIKKIIEKITHKIGEGVEIKIEPYGVSSFEQDSGFFIVKVPSNGPVKYRSWQQRGQYKIL
jgi:hypothetical protein